MEYRKREWKKYSKEYAVSHMRDLKIKGEVKVITDILKPKKGERVLDFGCNTGELCYILNKYFGVQTLGVDINGTAISIAKKKFPHLEFKKITPSSLNRLKKKFDAIVMMQVIEHLKTPDEQLKTLRELLTPKGRIIVSTPNKWAYFDKVKSRVLGKRFAYDPTHFHEFSPKTLRELFEGSGFEVKRVYTRGTAIIPFTRKIFGFGWGYPNYLIGGVLFISAKKLVKKLKKSKMSNETSE